jgi:type I restriction enzyme S subunit
MADRDEVEIRTGPFGTQLHASEYTELGVPVLNVRNIGFGSVLEDKLEHIGDETVRRLSGHLLQEGDIVFGRKGAVERHLYVRAQQSGWLQGSDCLRVRFKSRSVLPLFVSYRLLTDRHKSWMQGQCSHGATMPSLNQDIIRRIQLDLPPLPIQRRIASVLGAYDDLFENNLRRIKILEQMAQAIYREWFIEFRAPGVQLRKATPEEKKITGKDVMPKGWEIKKLGDVLRLLYGKALREQDRAEGGVPVYGSGGVVGFHNEALVDGPGIVVGRKGNVGSVYWTDVSFFPIDTVYYVETEIELHYVYFNIQRQNFISGDAAVPGLNRSYACSLPFLAPEGAVLAVFRKHMNGTFHALANLRQANANLRCTRDLLLPRLVAGDITC